MFSSRGRPWNNRPVLLSTVYSFSFRCINRLCELHIAIENFTEAGFTVLKHAELLKVMKKSFKTYGKVVFD